MNIEDWDYWLAKISDTENLTSYQKEKSKNALLKIKKFFGQDLSTLAQSGHPIWTHYIVNDISSTRLWFIEFADAIEMAKLQHNGQSIVDKLKNKTKFHDMLFELDIANRFKKAGFDIEFYPKPKNSQKIPDLKIINPDTGEQFFVEVTESKQSIQAKSAIDTFDRVSQVLFKNLRTNGRREFLCLCKIYKSLSEPHLNEISNKIISTIEKCAKSGFEELIDDGLKMVVAHEDKRAQLKEWGEKYNIHSHLEGPSYDVDEIYRLGTKITKEQKQLPKDHLNIVVIRDATTFFLFGKNVDTKIGELSEHVYKHDHLAFCSLGHIHWWSRRINSSKWRTHVYS